MPRGSCWPPLQQTGEDNWVVPASHGSTPSNRIWNITILRSPKQQIWLRTALCGGWCQRMALRNRELHARNDDDSSSTRKCQVRPMKNEICELSRPRLFRRLADCRLTRCHRHGLCLFFVPLHRSSLQVGEVRGHLLCPETLLSSELQNHTTSTWHTCNLICNGKLPVPLTQTTRNYTILGAAYNSKLLHTTASCCMHAIARCCMPE